MSVLRLILIVFYIAFAAVCSYAKMYTNKKYQFQQYTYPTMAVVMPTDKFRVKYLLKYLPEEFGNGDPNLLIKEYLPQIILKELLKNTTISDVNLGRLQEKLEFEKMAVKVGTNTAYLLVPKSGKEIKLGNSENYADYLLIIDSLYLKAERKAVPDNVPLAGPFGHAGITSSSFSVVHSLTYYFRGYLWDTHSNSVIRFGHSNPAVNDNMSTRGVALCTESSGNFFERTAVGVIAKAILHKDSETLCENEMKGWYEFAEMMVTSVIEDSPLDTSAQRKMKSKPSQKPVKRNETQVIVGYNSKQTAIPSKQKKPVIRPALSLPDLCFAVCPEIDTEDRYLMDDEEYKEYETYIGKVNCSIDTVDLFGLQFSSSVVQSVRKSVLAQSLFQLDDSPSLIKFIKDRMCKFEEPISSIPETVLGNMDLKTARYLILFYLTRGDTDDPPEELSDNDLDLYCSLVDLKNKFSVMDYHGDVGELEDEVHDEECWPCIVEKFSETALEKITNYLKLKM